MTPAGESNAACLPSDVRISPPACHSSASKRHTVSSLASLTYAQPNCFLAGSVSFLAAARRSSHVQFAVGNGMPACSEELLVVDEREVVHERGTPTILPSTVATWRSDGQKSFQSNDGSALM